MAGVGFGVSVGRGVGSGAVVLVGAGVDSEDSPVLDAGAVASAASGVSSPQARTAMVKRVKNAKNASASSFLKGWVTNTRCAVGTQRIPQICRMNKQLDPMIELGWFTLGWFTLEAVDIICQRVIGLS